MNIGSLNIGRGINICCGNCAKTSTYAMQHWKLLSVDGSSLETIKCEWKPQVWTEYPLIF